MQAIAYSETFLRLHRVVPLRTAEAHRSVNANLARRLMRLVPKGVIHGRGDALSNTTQVLLCASFERKDLVTYLNLDEYRKFINMPHLNGRI